MGHQVSTFSQDFLKKALACGDARICVEGDVTDASYSFRIIVRPVSPMQGPFQLSPQRQIENPSHRPHHPRAPSSSSLAKSRLKPYKVRVEFVKVDGVRNI